MPANARSAPWMPVIDLLPHLDAVVCHGGQNTVTEALLNGVPLVIAPIQFDQPAVAARVEALGAGVSISFEKAGARDIVEAVNRVVCDPSFREQAERIGMTLRPGTTRAADAVEALG